MLDVNFIIDSLPRLLPGLLLTVKLSLVGLALAATIGLPLGILHVEVGNKLVRMIIDLYVFFVRGTPILVQLYGAYFLIPMTGVKISPFWTGVCALVFNSAGYQIEIARAAVLSIDDGQTEGARALGLSKLKALKGIILPQAFPRMLPSLANEASNLVKASSVLSIIAVFELHKAANAVISQSYKFLEMLAAQAFLYVCFVIVLTQLSSWLEKRYGSFTKHTWDNR